VVLGGRRDGRSSLMLTDRVSCAGKSLVEHKDRLKGVGGERILCGRAEVPAQYLYVDGQGTRWWSLAEASPAGRTPAAVPRPQPAVPTATTASTPAAITMTTRRRIEPSQAVTSTSIST
jgi:hypothetical protein